MENTYWNDKGKFQTLLEELDGKTPSFGMVDNDYMNLYIMANRIYYDMYNNGGCNIKDCHLGDIQKYIEPFANELKGINFNVTYPTLKRNLNNEEKLEKWMDSVIEFVSKQDLTCTIFTVWMNYDEHTLSLTEKEGEEWREVTFGELEERDSWIQRRTASYFGDKLI